MKIALFSLGNLCAHRECRDRLVALGVRDLLAGLEGHPDAAVAKYAARIDAKLKAAGV